eukprot:1068044-Lingulodinium_polyedra.AAC.1
MRGDAAVPWRARLNKERGVGREIAPLARAEPAYEANGGPTAEGVVPPGTLPAVPNPTNGGKLATAENMDKI